MTETTAVIYSRRLSAVDDETSKSADRQLAACQAYAEEHGLTVTETYTDNGHSGWNAERPAYARLVQDVAAGKVEAVIAYDLTRFHRSTAAMAPLIDAMKESASSRWPQHGCAIHTVTDGPLDLASPAGTLLLAVMHAAPAKARREADRVRSGIRNAKVRAAKAAEATTQTG